MKTLLIVLLLAFAACKQAESPQAGDTSGTSATNTTVPGTPVEGAPATDTSVIGTQTGTAAVGTATPITNTDPPADAAPAPTAVIADGQTVYRLHCTGCHGLDGKKKAGNVTIASRETQSKPNSELVSRVRDVADHRALTLNEGEVTAVVSYIKALR